MTHNGEIMVWRERVASWERSIELWKKYGNKKAVKNARMGLKNALATIEMLERSEAEERARK